MKKIMTAIAAAVFIICPSLCFSSYIIHLKDGRAFATERYYEEEGQIKFKRYGGVIGIQKDLVREIEVIEEAEELPADKEKAELAKDELNPSAKKEGAEKGGVPDTAVKSGTKKEEKVEDAKKVSEQEKLEASEEEKKKAEQEKAAKMQAFLEEKRQIMRQMEIATSAFKEAKATKNKEKKNQYWNELLSLQNKFGKLRERVMAEHGGKLPPWWETVN